MKHPDKWRETIDISTLPLNKVTILSVLGYPHAGNDVFHVEVLFQGQKLNAFIKVERQFGADISNEVSIISQLPFTCVPEILEYSLINPKYIITKEIAGERLSTIVKFNPDISINKYLAKQAKMLTKIHDLQIKCQSVKDRKFFHLPDYHFCNKHGLTDVYTFLLSNPPLETNECFIHGDFHYANILWRENEIACVLDYELSGLGIKEFDIAWAVFLRPDQTFLTTWDEVEAFLEGYENDFSILTFCYFYIQIAVHFYSFGNFIYQQNIKNLIKKAITVYNENK